MYHGIFQIILLYHLGLLQSTKTIKSLPKQILNEYIYTVGTEGIQTPLHFSLFVILQPFANII